MNPFILEATLEQAPAWQALAHNGLASHAQEWEREWQRAQARAWLHAPTEPERPQALRFTPDRAVGEVSRNEGTAADPAVAHPCVIHASSQAAVGRSVVPSTCSVSACAATPGAPTHGQAPAQSQNLQGACKPEVRQVSVEDEPVGRTTTVGADLRRSTQDEVRLHVEGGVDDLHVWIGADGDEAAVSARAAAIFAELRRSVHLPSFRLASVVCNGQTLYACDPPSSPRSENPR
jgi:hypothetical protein